jgi:hypothetical protein
MRLAVIAALLLVPSIAAAQPGLTNPQNPDDEQPSTHRQPLAPVYAPVYSTVERPTPYAYPAPIASEQKSEGVATALAIGATTAGFMMIGSGASRGGDGMITAGLITMVIGPSAGHIYAGETGHAVKMSLLRGAGFVTFMAGAIKATTVHDVAPAEPCVDCVQPQPQHSSNNRDNAGTLMWIGGLTFVAASVYDMLDASRAARRTNIKNAHMLTVVPSYAQTQSGAVAPGVALTGRF